MSRNTLHRAADALAPFAFGALVLIAWDRLVVYYQVPHYILPRPLSVAEALWQDGPGLLASLWVTVRITLAALAAAIVGGGALAVIFAQSRVLERTLLPYAVILQVTPIVSIAPLIMIWVKGTFAALLLCAWIVAFFPIVANTTLGLNSVDRNLLALMRLYGASRGQVLRLVKVPAALPNFLAGVRISGGLALIGAVVAEFVAGTGGTETGLASRVLEAGYRLEIARMFAGLVLLSLTGIAIFAIVSGITHLALRRWHESALPEEE